LHTVIITEPDVRSKLKLDKYAHFFAPFEREGTVCHCRWNKGAEKIEDALYPKLYDVIENHPEWRVIILVNSPAKEELYDPDNPFDFKCNHAKIEKSQDGNDKEIPIQEGDLFLERNKSPLVELTHMLAGFPSLGVRNYDTGYVYYNNDTKKYETCTDKNGNPYLESSYDNKEDMQEHFNQFWRDFNEYTKKCNNEKKQRKWDEFSNFCKNDILKNYIKNCVFENNRAKIDEYLNICKEEARKKLHEVVKKEYGSELRIKLVEIPYTDEEKDKHRELTEKYTFNENRPVEILLLSIREYTTDDREKTCEKIERSWKFYDESESSDFWKIYPNTCRFLCYDIVNKDHTLYSCDCWRFSLLALTLANNKIPGQFLHAYRLYNVDLQIDADKLRDVYNKYMENLLSFREILQERLSRISELTQDKKKELVPEQYISVDFGQIEESEVRASSKNIGFAKDCPVDEELLWYKHLKGTRHTVENILYAPQEIVAEKALETRDRIDSFEGIEQVLDRFQKERIEKRIDELEQHVINSQLHGMLDTNKYINEVSKAGENVQKYIKFRLTKRKILLISLCSLLVYICGYIPYLVNSARIDWTAFGRASVLVVASLILLAGGGMLAILILRLKLVKKINIYNNDVSNIFNIVKDSARDFSDYFSNVCTYMYARSLLSGVILKKNRVKSIHEIYNEHLERIENELKEYKKICNMYNVPINISEINDAFMNIDEELLEKTPSQCNFYELDRLKEKDTVKLTSSANPKQTRKTLTSRKDDHWDMHDTGITLDAPYSFITGLNLVVEEIYKKEGA
jgi:hypothetical protein